MKRTIFTLSLLLAAVILNNSVSAAILRVNNNTGVSGTGVYATLQLGYDAAAAGDTLLIEGSNTSYADLVISKKIIIFGTGYLLTNNTQTQASFITSKLGNLSYAVGSDGSVIMGCTINSIVVAENNITIARNYISNSTLASASINLNGNNSNIIIKQNLIYGLINNTAGKTPSVVIKNNLIGKVLFTESISSALIINNTFYQGYLVASSLSDYAIDVCNSIVTSNIVLYTTFNPGYYPYSANTGMLKFNSTQLNTITYNYLNEADPGSYNGSNNLFSQVHPFTTASPNATIDNNFVVISGNPAETGAQDAGQCGMFGGSEPYVLSGMPPIPHIYKLESDPAGTNTDPLNVKISVKAQN